MNRLSIIWITGSLLIASCSQNSFYSPKEYLRFINEPGNGFVKTREYDQINFKVKYLSPDFFVSNEFMNQNPDCSKLNDSIYNLYRRTRSFVLTISTSKENDADVMVQGIASEEEYRDRFDFMNFNIGNYIYLKTAKNKYYPSLTNLENVYGLSKNRNINLVFSPVAINDDLTESDEYELVYEDVIYNTGVSHFTFKKSDIDKKFSLKFLKSTDYDKE